MSDNNDWVVSSLEEEIAEAEAIDRRLMDTDLDRDTQNIIKQRLLSRIQLEMLNEY